MTAALSVDDFADFFFEIHGRQPFPWQKRLLRLVVEQCRWPKVLDLPTGFGKTSALDIAVFHLALEAGKGAQRKAPVRIALVVDRRLVVDDAHARAKKIAEALKKPTGRVCGLVVAALRPLAEEGGAPLVAQRLRGGIPKEDDWARTPSQPSILCSTVDQVGSRLLFRGYGVSGSMKPVHAGLLGSDCLILLDEAHLSRPFRQTLDTVAFYRSEKWREQHEDVAPWGVALLTATPDLHVEPEDRFPLAADDLSDPILSERWLAAKPAFLIEESRERIRETEAGASENDAEARTKDLRRIASLVAEGKRAFEALRSQGLANPAIGIVANRVSRARAVFEALREQFSNQEAEFLLMIGPARSIDRDEHATSLDPIRTGAERNLSQPLFVIATQCLEVGVDIDLDGLVTETAPLDALRQRFGRLRRAGDPGRPCFASIVGGKTDAKDPIYGEAAWNTWNYLAGEPDQPASKSSAASVDFGLSAFAGRMKELQRDGRLPSLLSEEKDAPVLMPTHLDLLSQTSPIPNADPEVALYLHGPETAPDTVSVVWRADVERSPKDMSPLLSLMPPRSAEAIELPLWTVRRWLAKQSTAALPLADVPAAAPEEPSGKGARPAFRWRGEEESSGWISPHQIRPGDTLVVPASYGGVDAFGWNPEYEGPVSDVALRASLPFAGRHFVVRVAPGLLSDPEQQRSLSKAIAETGSRDWKTLRTRILELGVVKDEAYGLEVLESARRSKVQVFDELYGEDWNGDPRGVVFVAPLGISSEGLHRGPQRKQEELSIATTEDDEAGSFPGVRISLMKHCLKVAEKTESFARATGLSEARVQDLRIAGELHDTGKADPRFQSLLFFGDPLAGRGQEALAKSERKAPRAAWVRAGLPKPWRHEALSVRLAPQMKHVFEAASDPELVLWLIGTHHGKGRPLFPHTDPKDEEDRSDLMKSLDLRSPLPAGPGPQSLAYDWKGLDWPSLFVRLKARYGVWELARMEAVLRLADHRTSEEEKEGQADLEQGGTE